MRQDSPGSFADVSFLSHLRESAGGSQRAGSFSILYLYCLVCDGHISLQLFALALHVIFSKAF